MRGGDSGLEGYQEEQERRYTEQERCCQKGGMQESKDSRDEGCKFGSEMALIKIDNFNLTGTVFFFRQYSFNSFRLITVLYHEIRNWLSHAKAS